MTIWKTPVSLEIINKRGRNTMIEHLNIIFTEFGDHYLKASMQVNERTRQPLGIMHGGASCVLAETVGSTAANFAIDIKTHVCVGLSINTNHIRSITSGEVLATASPLHLGRSTQVWRIDIVDGENRLISATQLTMAVLDKDKKYRESNA